uniref:ATP synthase subunit 6 n=1 Tax=Taenia laticollis TaxID=1035110 RepID=N0DMI2_9CEST|nr:ATP synthase F0 subunit 6 [Taenia laticollis]BAN15634.1 ATP synthase subunit 6 [Taenia laticollis]
MIFISSDFGSFISLINHKILDSVSWYYFMMVNCVLLLFLFYRLPYCYSPYLFWVFLVVVVFTGFISLFLGRLCSDVNVFFSTFIPVGTPIYICPLVCLAELISYIIRPIVLILRPFINISLGCFGAIALGSLSFLNGWWCILLVLLFFYEVFVALVHWYIVTCILSFSVDH